MNRPELDPRLRLPIPIPIAVPARPIKRLLPLNGYKPANKPLIINLLFDPDR